MKILENEIRKNKFLYRQIKRTKTKAIYEQCIDNNVIGYEVFKILISEEKEVFGVKYPKMEIFPKNNDFGSTAWSIPNKNRALEFYDGLN